jgi:serine protease Do
MDNFKHIDDSKEIYEGKIKFNKKKKSSKNKFIVLTLIYILLTSISGVCIAVILNNNNAIKSGEPSLESETSLSQVNNEYADLMTKLSKSVVSIIKVVGDDTHSVEVDSGSGVIFKEGGYIVTNHHVIEGAKVLKVKLYNDTVYIGSIIGINNTYDLAIIKIEAENLAVMKVGSSVGLEYGKEVLSIGNPMGKAFDENKKLGMVLSVSEPIITIDRTTGVHSALNVINTNLIPSSINSGGALCDTKGELVGINSISMNHVKGTIKSSFHMTIEDAKPIINELLNGENALRTILGVYAEEAVPESKEGIQGIYIKEVIRDSSAYEAGLRPTDIILEFNGKKIKYIKDMNEAIEEFKTPQTVKCKVFKNGEYKILDIKIKTNN